MVQIVAVNVVFVVVEPGHALQPRLESMCLARLRAFHGAKFALPDQSLAEIGIEHQIVGANEPGEGNFVACSYRPAVAGGQQSGVRLIHLARVNCV